MFNNPDQEQAMPDTANKPDGTADMDAQIAFNHEAPFYYGEVASNMDSEDANILACAGVAVLLLLMIAAVSCWF